MMVLLVTAGSFSVPVIAQEQTKDEKQRETELKKAIDEQKKAIEEQKRAQEEAQQQLRENLKELEKLNDYDMDIDVDESGNQVRVYSRRGNRPYNFNMVIPDVPDVPGAPMMYGHFFAGDNERTTWEFTKSLKENSFKKEYTFDVEKTAKSVVMAVSGDCKAGEIRIKILTPTGKSYSDTVIDEYGNINVRKSFNISDTENKDKTGEWKFQISSEKATGYFKISLQVF